MNDIKFRVWFCESKLMSSPVSIEELLFEDGHYFDWRGIKDFGQSVVIMQYTGLTDKNGVEIYEGDILHIPATTLPKGEGGYVQSEHNYLVSWDKLTDGTYAESYYSGFRLPIGNATFSDIEVIGNIHENQELVEADNAK